MDQGEATPIPRTEGAIEPFFSPDGQWIAFWADDQLKKVSVTGGAPVTLSETRDFYGASWGPDDNILLGMPNVGVLRVPGAGGTPEVIVPVEGGEVNLPRPQLLPGGEWLLFSVYPSQRVAVQSLVTGERHVLIENGGGDVRYLPTGHVVHVLDGTLLAQPFDVDRLTITGGPVALVEGITQTVFGHAQFDHADDGTLVYETRGALALATLVWVDRQGNEEPVAAEPSLYRSVQLSPDGQRVVTEVGGSDTDLFVYDLSRETPSQFTFEPGQDSFPIFTPDGARIVWSSAREGVNNIFWKAADGTGQVERLTTSENRQGPYSWSGDGQTLVMVEQRANETSANADIGALSMDGEGTIDWLLEGNSNEGWPDVSPDGRWMAYTTNESGQYEVIVQPFPNVDDGLWKISQDGGFTPQWGPDSRELFFQTNDGTIMVATAVTEPTFRVGIPVPVVNGPYLIGAPLRPRAFDISPDGQQLLMIKINAAAAESGEQPEVHVVLNWDQELLERVPIP